MLHFFDGNNAAGGICQVGQMIRQCLKSKGLQSHLEYPTMLSHQSLGLELINTEEKQQRVTRKKETYVH